MRRRKDGTHFKELLRQFYQIHEASTQSLNQNEPSTSNPVDKVLEGIECDNQYEDQDETQQKNRLMKTTSTEINESKIRNWEENTLREIEQKSQGEQNSNECENSIQKYAFREKQPSPSSRRQYQAYLDQKYQKKQKNPPEKRKYATVNGGKNKKKRGNIKNIEEKKQSQLIVSLKYQHDKSQSNTFRIGMKMLNKQWLKALDSIHRNI